MDEYFLNLNMVFSLMSLGGKQQVLQPIKSKYEYC